MNLILLLSALLSAITGVNAGPGRAPVVAEQVARATQVASAAVAMAARAVPAHAIDPVTARLQIVPVMRLSIVATPLYASRRRE